MMCRHHKMRAAFGTLMVAAVVWAPDAGDLQHICGVPSDITLTGDICMSVSVCEAIATCAVVAIWPATFLQGPGAATGIALINTIGSFGRAPPAPWLSNMIKD